MSRGVIEATTSMESLTLGKTLGLKESRADKPGKSPGQGGTKLNMVRHDDTNSSHVNPDDGETVKSEVGSGLRVDEATVVRHGGADSALLSIPSSHSSHFPAGIRCQRHDDGRRRRGGHGTGAADRKIPGGSSGQLPSRALRTTGLLRSAH